MERRRRIDHLFDPRGIGIDCGAAEMEVAVNEKRRTYYSSRETAISTTSLRMSQQSIEQIQRIHIWAVLIAVNTSNVECRGGVEEWIWYEGSIAVILPMMRSVGSRKVGGSECKWVNSAPD